jgi:hypothetical protein
MSPEGLQMVLGVRSKDDRTGSVPDANPSSTSPVKLYLFVYYYVIKHVYKRLPPPGKGKVDTTL